MPIYASVLIRHRGPVPFGLDRVPSRQLDLQRLRSLSSTGGATAQVGADIAENSGRWVKLTAESAEAVKKYGLMPTKKRGITHAMIGQPGDIKKWLQIERTPIALLSGPFALTVLSTMMQQRAMQQQMDEIVNYLQEIDEKVDDILRGQKDAVLAKMIGVDLIVEEALTLRDEVGRVSETTWSKVQQTGMTIATTQAYALRQLDATPDELESHRVGLSTARQNRLELIGRSISRLLTQMGETVHRANSKVLFHPFDSPAAVKSSNQVAMDVHEFRGRLGIESGHVSNEAKGWTQAAVEVRDRVLATGAEAFDRATDAFRSVDVDGDGIPDRPRAGVAAEEAGAALKGAAVGMASAFGTLFKRRQDTAATPEAVDPETEAQGS